MADVADTAALEEPDAVDERLRRVSLVAKLLTIPGMGAVIALVLVYIFFAIIAYDNNFVSWLTLATILNTAAPLGIVAVGVGLLMIGGDFDLSVGSMFGIAGMVLMLLVTPTSQSGYGWDVWLAIPAAFLLAAGIGAFNGVLVVVTKLPSFIITLGSLYILRGLAVAWPRQRTNRTQLSGIQDAPGYGPLEALFETHIRLFGAKFDIAVVWMIGLTVLGTVVLSMKAGGNWIFGIGGDRDAARNIGVPVHVVRISLFMTTAVLATLAALSEVVGSNGADSLRGELLEFEAIVAVVIGGTLLTGGYGSVVGAVIGAVIFAMVEQGIVITGIDADWSKVALGTVLVVAVIFNNFIRSVAMRR